MFAIGTAAVMASTESVAFGSAFWGSYEKPAAETFRPGLDSKDRRLHSWWLQMCSSNGLFQPHKNRHGDMLLDPHFTVQVKPTMNHPEAVLLNAHKPLGDEGRLK